MATIFDTVPDDPNPMLLTEHEAAKKLSVSASTLTRLRRQGKIGYVSVGRLVRYSPAQLADWITKNSTGVPVNG